LRLKRVLFSEKNRKRLSHAKLRKDAKKYLGEEIGREDKDRKAEINLLEKRGY